MKVHFKTFIILCSLNKLRLTFLRILLIYHPILRGTSFSCIWSEQNLIPQAHWSRYPITPIPPLPVSPSYHNHPWQHCQCPCLCTKVLCTGKHYLIYTFNFVFIWEYQGGIKVEMQKFVLCNLEAFLGVAAQSRGGWAQSCDILVQHLEISCYVWVAQRHWH